MADKFKFLVGGGLTLRNIVFNAVDSLIIPSLDVSNCLSSSGTCCTVSGSTLGGAASCVFAR